MEKVKVLAKGQVVIPAAIRKKYNIEPGVELQVFEYGSIIYLVPPSKDPVGDAKGCLPGKPSLSEQLIEYRRTDFRK